MDHQMDIDQPQVENQQQPQDQQPQDQQPQGEQPQGEQPQGEQPQGEQPPQVPQRLYTQAESDHTWEGGNQFITQAMAAQAQIVETNQQRVSETQRFRELAEEQLAWARARETEATQAMSATQHMTERANQVERRFNENRQNFQTTHILDLRSWESYRSYDERARAELLRVQQLLAQGQRNQQEQAWAMWTNIWTSQRQVNLVGNSNAWIEIWAGSDQQPVQAPVPGGQLRRADAPQAPQAPRALQAPPHPWTELEDVCLAVNCMFDHTLVHIAQTVPELNGRTAAAMSSHLKKMRQEGKLPAAWKTKASELTDTAWDIEEDMEALRWHASGRYYIDAKIFIPNDRTGQSVRARADYLIQDKELEEVAQATEDEAKNRQLEEDSQMALDTEEGEERQDEAELREQLRQAIVRSLATRN